MPPRPERHEPGAGAHTTAADLDLAHRVASGDTRAEADLFARYAGAVHRFVQRSLGPDQDARDMTQEVFLAVFARLPALRRIESLRSYVFAIAANMVRVELRRRRFRHLLRTALQGEVRANAVRAPAPETMIAGRRAYAAIDRLRVREREAFVLHHLEGLPLPEIAAITGQSLATVKRRIAAAQERLRRVVERNEEVEGE